MNKFQPNWFDRICLRYPPGWLVFVHRHWNHYHPRAKSFTLFELALFLLPGGQYLALLLKSLRERRSGEGVFDKEYQKAFQDEVLSVLCEKQFRPQLFGVEKLPDEPPLLLMMNHAGMTFPWDFVALAYLLRNAKGWDVQPVAHTDLFDHPLVKLLLPEHWSQVLGGIKASRPDIKKALSERRVIIFAPEAARGPAKGWSRRYRLERFDPSMVTLSKRYNVPLYSALCVGSEEVSRWAENWREGARRFKLPLFPISPLTPLILLYPSLLFWGMKTKIRIFIEGQVKLEGVVTSTREAYLEAQRLRDEMQRKIDRAKGS